MPENIDYRKHIAGEVAGAKTTDNADEGKLLQVIANSLLDIAKINRLSFVVTISSTHVWFSFSTTTTTRDKIDLIKELGSPSTEVYIVSSGGGFDMEINDEANKIRASDNMRIYNELINHVYVTCYGKAGTGQIRFGVSK